MVTHYGVVTVANVANAGFAGQIAGAFVPAADLELVEGATLPMAGAPGCFEVLPLPAVVPGYLDAGTLQFDGLILADHTVTAGVEGDYSFEYTGLWDLPDTPLTLTVSGGAVIEPMAAVVSTPDAATPGSWLEASTGVNANWTAGNGDFVLLGFSNSLGDRVCEVPDTGSFLIPAQAFAPETTPLGTIRFQRVIETTSLSASFSQELRFRAITEDQLLAL